MRILDLDLDFFMRGRVRWVEEERPSLSEVQPWTDTEVVEYIKNNLGIDYQIPLHVVDTHDEALHIWKDLDKPFEVVHVDAHSDLGMDDSYKHIMTDFWRTQEVKNLTEGNYLIYAIAMGWVKKLVYVGHTCDVPVMYKGRNSLQIHRCKKGNLSKHWKKLTEAIKVEIPFKYVSYSKYINTQRFDCVILSRSERYVPVEADRLVGLLLQSIVERF